MNSIKDLEAVRLHCISLGHITPIWRKTSSTCSLTRPSRFHTLPTYSLIHINLTIQLPTLLQLNQPAENLIQRHQLAHLLRGGIIAISDIHRSRLLLFRTDH